MSDKSAEELASRAHRLLHHVSDWDIQRYRSRFLNLQEAEREAHAALDAALAAARREALEEAASIEHTCYMHEEDCECVVSMRAAIRALADKPAKEGGE